MIEKSVSQKYLLGEKLYPVSVENPHSLALINGDFDEFVCGSNRYIFKCDGEHTLVRASFLFYDPNDSRQIILYKFDNARYYAESRIFRTKEEAEDFCLKYIPKDPKGFEITMRELSEETDKT